MRNYATEQGLAEKDTLKKGIEEKSQEFVEKGAEIPAKAQNILPQINRFAGSLRLVINRWNRARL